MSRSMSSESDVRLPASRRRRRRPYRWAAVLGICRLTLVSVVAKGGV